MTQNVDATFYVKIGGLGTSSGLYRFTTREAASGDVPILLDVPSVVSSRMDPLQPIGSDESIRIRLAYETADHAAKVRPLVRDPSATDPVYATAGTRSPIQLTESIGPTSTSIKLTSTVGLSTGTLYYLGGDALTFSAFPDSTTATASRGTLSPFGGGFFHDAPDELGPLLTSTLPTGAGQRVEFGRIVGGSEEVIFRGRLREEEGVRLVDGTAIEIDVVSVSSAVRNAAISPPRGVVLHNGLTIDAQLAEVVIRTGATNSGLYIFADDNGPASEYVTSSPGFVHVIDAESGDYATFEITGFGTADTILGRPAYLVNVAEGATLAGIGNGEGRLGIGDQTAEYSNGTRRELQPDDQYRFARNLLENTSIRGLRVELALSADDLAGIFNRALTAPDLDVRGMSAELPSDCVDIPASVRASLRGITNTNETVPAAFILPPFDADAGATFGVGQVRRVYRGRSSTLAAALEGACKPYGLSLLTRSDGTVALVDWITLPTRFDLRALDEDDLADTQSEQAFTAGPTAPVLAVVPPEPVPLFRRGDGRVLSTEAATIVVKSSRPVTSAQIQALESIETKHAVGDVAGLQEVASRMETAADLYGLPRPEVTATYLGGSTADDIEPGTFYTLSHPDVARSNGQRGLTNARAVCVEKAVDVATGSVTIRSRILGHEAQELATWAPCGKIFSWLDPNLTIEPNAFTDAGTGTGPTTDAQAFDLDLPSSAIVLDSRGEFRGSATINSRSGNVLNVTPLKGLVPAAGDLITVASWGGTSGEWLDFAPTDNGGPPCYGGGLDDALGGVPGDPAQRYR